MKFLLTYTALKLPKTSRRRTQLAARQSQQHKHAYFIGRSAIASATTRGLMRDRGLLAHMTKIVRM
eukprot:11453118-Karenia_brevis.AAC.1